jgi:hypothetical protein
VAFLLARVSARRLQMRPAWVTGRGKPWTSLDPVDLDASTATRVYGLYAKVYGRIDSSLNLRNPDALFEFDRWILVEDEPGALIGFVLLKTTACGLKVGLTGSDGSTQGKASIKAFHRTVYDELGVYAEVSDALETVVNGFAPVVPARKARLVLHPKLLDDQPDGKHHAREIARVGRRVKLMVGRPVLPGD